MKSELRFCIGSPEGRHSTAWKIWTNKNDVYLSSRALASDMKISLHKSGHCSFSKTSESFARSGKPNKERHLQKWVRRAPYPVNDVINLFRIVIPESELRQACAERKSAKNIVWHPAPPIKYGAYIELWLTPAQENIPDQTQFINRLLGVLTLSDGRFVGVTCRYLRIEPYDTKLLRKLNTQAIKESTQNDPRMRGWALVLNEQNVHAIIEYAPYPD